MPGDAARTEEWASMVQAHFVKSGHRKRLGGRVARDGGASIRVRGLDPKTVKRMKALRPGPFVDNLSEAEPALVRSFSKRAWPRRQAGSPVISGYRLDMAQRAIDTPGCCPIAVG